MARPAVLLGLLGLLLSSNCSLSPPRISFLLDSGGRPLVRFSLPDLHGTTTLLLSNDGSTLFVGAKNTILSLNVAQSDVISLKNKVLWSPSDKDIEECSSKGKVSTVDCPNIIHVLQPLNSTHLYTCGSYAYSPQEAFIDTESFSIVQQNGAKGRCPFSPFERSTAIIIDSELFTATTTDFRGLKPQISRYFTKGGPDVSLETSICLLKEPTFVSSSLDPAEGKLYFFFSEVGKEFSYVDELKTARVAQVCKDDIGGQRTLQKKWTSFAKAALLCRSQKELPFNILHDVFTLQPPEGSTTDTLFYGVFTTQWPRVPVSAVCVFKLKDIKKVFKESYRTFIMESHQWSLVQESYSSLGKCGLHNSTDAVLGEVKRSFLTRNPVTPFGNGPVVVSSEQQYSRVAVMRAQAADGKQYTMLFLITESGFLHKVALFDQGPQVLEEIQIFRQPQPVKSILLSSSKGVLYVGTSEGVTAVPVAHCSTYRTCSQCLLTRDPLCGWSRTDRVCTRLDGSHQDMVQNLEDGDLEEKCQGQTEADMSTEIQAHLNQVVTLSCLKPSNLATLTWTSTRFESLPKNRFVQSADGSLIFLVTEDTCGTYRCEAEERGYKEEIKRYDIHLKQPRYLSPRTHQSVSAEEPDENIATKDPAVFLTQHVNTHTYTTKASNNGFTNSFKDEMISSERVSETKIDQTLTSVRDSQHSSNPSDIPLKEKSYYSELVVVSLLLALCICSLILGSLHVWRQGKVSLKRDPLVTPNEGSNTNKAMESCSLSSPEVKVME